MAGRVISGVTGEAERVLGIPRDVTEYSIRVSLDLDGGLGDSLDEFLRRVMTPTPTHRSTDQRRTAMTAPAGWGPFWLGAVGSPVPGRGVTGRWRCARLRRAG